MSNIVISGANEGIGFHMAKALLEAGHRVAVLDIALDGASVLAETHPGSCLCIKADVRDFAALERAVAEAASSFGGIDAAVQNACLCPFEIFSDGSDEVYLSSYYVNFLGAVHLARAALPHMNEGGRIAFTSSGVGVTGFPSLSAYASTKGAIEALAKCLRLEYPQYSFHILHPPLTRTRSSSPLPLPKEFMSTPYVVGRGLARRLFSRRFIICHSVAQKLQTLLCYLAPLSLGSLMAKMTSRAGK